MPRWSFFSSLAAMLFWLPARGPAMGSGPHPNLPYGIPPVAHPPVPMPYQSPPAILWLIPALACAGLLFLALQHKRNQ